MIVIRKRVAVRQRERMMCLPRALLTCFHTVLTFHTDVIVFSNFLKHFLHTPTLFLFKDHRFAAGGRLSLFGTSYFLDHLLSIYDHCLLLLFGYVVAARAYDTAVTWCALAAKRRAVIALLRSGSGLACACTSCLLSCLESFDTESWWTPPGWIALLPLP